MTAFPAHRPFPLSRRLVPACALACLAWLAPPAAWAADDWSQEGQDASAGSFNGEQSALNAGNLDQVVKLWARNLDLWEQSTGLVASDSQVFLGRKIADPQTTIQQQLVRLDPATGATVWKVNLPEQINTPALTPTLVIAAALGNGRRHGVTRVRAFDRATGQRRWLYEHPEPVMFRAPHVLDGVVYLVSTTGDAVALDADTGAVRWQRHLPGSDTYSTQGLAVADGVMVATRNGGIIAVDANDGHVLWRHALPEFHIVGERPLIVGRLAVLFDLDGPVYAYDLATGAQRWMYDAGKSGRSYGPMATDGQRLFVMNGVVSPRVTAIDLATGAMVWTAHQRRWAHSPVVSNGVLYLATDRHLLAIDAASGAPLPMARLPAERIGALSIAEGRLLMGGGPVRAYGLPAN